MNNYDPDGGKVTAAPRNCPARSAVVRFAPVTH